MPSLLHAYRLAPQQKRLCRLRTDPATAVGQLCIGLHGPLDLQRLRAACADLLTRHPALRTALVTAVGLKLPLQRLAETADLAFDDLDLRSLPQAEQALALAAIAAQQARLPLGLAQGQMTRFCLVRGGAQQHRLLITVSWLAADSASLNLL